MIKKVLLSLSALLCLIACDRTEGPQFSYTNVYGFAEVRGNVLSIPTQGLDLYVSQDKTDGKWASCSRIFYCCDIFLQSAGSNYEATLKDYAPVTSATVRKKSLSSESTYGTDAVCFYQDWGMEPPTPYFNLSCQITRLKNSSTGHSVSLVFDDTRSNRDTLFFELHHQGQGESYENTAHEADAFEVETRYLTFDLSQAIPADAGDDIVLSLEWDWFKVADQKLKDREKVHQQAFGTMRLKY